MSKEDILRIFYTNNLSLGVQSILLIMLGGLCIGLIIALCYYVSCRSVNGVQFNRRFAVSLITTLLISVVIMLMISSNIVISLGMVGALSIVRFRTAIKDSRDTIFLFFAITEGLCVGSQNFRLAVVTTLFIGILIICASLLPAMRPKYLYIVRGGADPIDAGVLREVLSVHTKDFRFRSSGLDKTHQEFIMEVRLKEADTTALCEKLSLIPGVTAVNWISESGENLG